MTVPQVGHLPFMALRPFFIVSSTPSTISFLALHLTQYPSGIESFAAFGASCALAAKNEAYGLPDTTVNSEKACRTGIPASYLYNMLGINPLRMSGASGFRTTTLDRLAQNQTKWVQYADISTSDDLGEVQVISIVRKVVFRILPVAFRGKAAIKMILRGTL
jgi:hypothetical protein